MPSRSWSRPARKHQVPVIDRLPVVNLRRIDTGPGQRWGLSHDRCTVPRPREHHRNQNLLNGGVRVAASR